LPSEHVADNYALAWVGFDIALVCLIALTAWAGYRRSPLLIPFATATATLLICDAWFDVVTSTPGERLEAALEAGFAELPLALLCAFIVYDAERVLSSVFRLRGR
jgi:hypothetical protein